MHAHLFRTPVLELELPELGLTFLQLVVFLLFLFMVKRWIIGPAMDLLKRRREKEIELKEAIFKCDEKIESFQNRITDEEKALMEAASRERDRLIKEAEKRVEELKKEAGKKVEELREEAIVRVKIELEKVRDSFFKEVDRYLSALSHHIISGKIFERKSRE